MGVTFIDNRADESGSVLYLESQPASISDSSFTGNTAGDGNTIHTVNSPIDWDCRLGSWMPTEGTFQGDFSAPECYYCPAGYYGATSGLTEPGQCGQCTRGHFCEMGTTNPEPCPPGRYSPVFGAPSPEFCLPCAPGTYQPLAAQEFCITCPAGSFSPDVGLAACDPCPRGGYCEEAGAATSMVWEPCPTGSFNPSNGSSSSAACELCPAGTASATRGAESSETCVPCRPGTVAAAAGLSECASCGGGTYQDGTGATGCRNCVSGHYCAKGAAAPLPCDGGTYSSATDNDEQGDCTAANPGYFATTGSTQQTPCAPGSIAPSAKMSACVLCPKGNFAASGTACEQCEAGTYAAREGLSQCTLCPHPLSSKSGDVTCSICKEGFYLRDASAHPDDIFRFPTKHCKACPPDVKCATNTTLETLGVRRDYWRASPLTTEIHECDASDHCSGSGSAADNSRRRLAGSGGAGPGCDLGHTGPLCEWCVSDEQYFSRAERGCVDCPTTERFGILAGVVVALAGTALLLYHALPSTEAWGRFGARAKRRLEIVESQVAGRERHPPTL